MTVTAIKTFQDPQDGDGVTLSFPFSLRNDALSDIRCEILRADGSVIVPAFSVSGDSSGGTVTLDEAPSAVEKVLIFRLTDLTQKTNYTSGDFPSSAHERAADKLTMAAQERASIAERTLRFNQFSPAISEMAPVRVKRTIVRTETGFAEGPTTDEISNAQGYAEAAGVSETNAANSANAASASSAAAADSASGAEQSNIAAAASASNAAASETNSQNAATSAINSASGALVRAGEALASANAAAASEANAQASATSAGQSETNASSSASAAAASEANAAASAEAAGLFDPSGLARLDGSDFTGLVSTANNVSVEFGATPIRKLGVNAGVNYSGFVPRLADGSDWDWPARLVHGNGQNGNRGWFIGFEGDESNRIVTQGGLGGFAGDIPIITDSFNINRPAGFYRCNFGVNPIGTPAPDWATIVRHHPIGIDYAFQEAIQFDGNHPNAATYKRYQNAGVWTAWVRTDIRGAINSGAIASYNSRGIGTNYTNTSGRPILHMVTLRTTTSNNPRWIRAEGKVDGAIVISTSYEASSISGKVGVTFVCPPGSVARVDASSNGQALDYWKEWVIGA